MRRFRHWLLHIPGTETCLKFGGYVRFQTDFGRDKSGVSDWDLFTRAQFEVDTRTDTELGALRGFIGLRGNADNGSSSSSSVFVDQAFIELGGLKVGKFYSWWDDGLSGESDVLSTNALFNSIRYTYDAGSFWAGVSVDELEGTGSQFATITGPANDYKDDDDKDYKDDDDKDYKDDDDKGLGLFPLSQELDNNVGIALGLGAKLGAASLQLIGGYDIDQEEGAIRLIATADLGPGTLGLAGVWASGANAYYAKSEWAVAAEYAIKATDKLTITPGGQYFGNVADRIALTNAAGVPTGASAIITNDWSNRDAWQAGVTIDYKITSGLSTKVAVNYYDEDNRDEQWKGFVRLQRSF